MSKTQYMLTLALAFVAGLVGSMVSNRLFVNDPAFAQQTPQRAEVIRARSIELVDSLDRVIIELGVKKEEDLEYPHLTFWSTKHDKANVALSVVEGNPSLILDGRDGHIHLGSWPWREPCILIDGEGSSRVKLAVTREGEPGLVLFGKNGYENAPQIGLIVDGKQGPTMFLIDRGRKVRSILNLMGGDPKLALYDRNAKTRAVFGLSPNGGPILGFTDENGKATWSVP